MCCNFKLVLAENVIRYLFGLAAVVFAGATIRTGRAFGSGVARRLSGWLPAVSVSEPRQKFIPIRSVGAASGLASLGLLLPTGRD
jgi:hypothetical protein